MFRLIFLIYLPSTPFTFDVCNLDADTITKQIVCIQADLYKQLQITELLDLRYQKREKGFAVSLNKIHLFSNKIYLLVPTTILQQEEIRMQAKIYKKWITVCEVSTTVLNYSLLIITEPYTNERLQQCCSSYKRLKRNFNWPPPSSNFCTYTKNDTKELLIATESFYQVDGEVRTVAKHLRTRTKLSQVQSSVSNSPMHSFCRMLFERPCLCI